MNNIGNGKILVQLFTRGKPFLGNDYQKELSKILDIEERVLIALIGISYKFKFFNWLDSKLLLTR